MKTTSVLKYCLFISSILTLSSLPAFAQENPNESKIENINELSKMSLEDMLNIQIEAATKTNISQIEVPQAITTLTHDEISRIPANNLGELLRSVVGMNVVRIQSSQSVLGSRGSNAFSPSKILILIDGQAIDPTLFSATWWELVPISINDIERIELIRSPGTIYGANAENGVVNIITKKINLDQPDAQKLELVGKYGMQNLIQGYVGYMGKVGDVSYRVSGELYDINAYQNTQQLQLVAVPAKKSSAGEQTFDDNKNHLNLQNFTGAFQAKLFNNELSANIGFKNIANAEGRIPDRLCFIGLQGYIGYLNIKYPFEFLDINHNFSFGLDRINYKILRNGNSTDPKLSPAEMSLNELNFGYELQKKFLDTNNLLFGLNLNLETAQNVSGVPFFNNAQLTNKPVFNATLQDEWRITPSDRLYVGGLLSDHYISGFSLSPLLAYVHKFDDKNVARLATFTSNRNPNVFEHSMDYDQPTGNTGKVTKLIPNNKLFAERTTSYELGYRSQPLEELFFSTDLYYNQLRNGIEWTQVGNGENPARPEYRSDNSLEQNIGGAEVVIKYALNNLLVLENNFSFNTNLNKSTVAEYQGSTGLGVNNAGQGRYGEEYVPPFIYNAILNFNWNFIHANVQYQYTADHVWQWPTWDAKTGKDVLGLKPVVGYGLLNAYLGFDITRYIVLSVEGNNLLDNLHTEWRGDESYFGRTLAAKVSFKI